MPYVSDSNLDDKNQAPGSSAPNQQVGQVSGQPQAVSGQTGSQSQAQNSNSATQAPQAPTLATGGGTTTPAQGGGAAAGSSSSQSTPAFDSNAPTSSGQWTNLQDYLKANNGGQFGQDFSGKVGDQVTQAQSGISNAATNFKNQVTSGTVQDNADVDAQVGTAPEKMSKADQTTFENELNGSYGGPATAANDPGLSQAQNQAHSAFSEAQQAQTPGGQQALLQKYYNQPNYTQGGQALDSAILSADPNAQSALSSLASQASGLPVSAKNAYDEANARAAEGAGTSAATRDAAIAALYGTGGSAADIKGGAFGKVENAINSQVTADNNSRDAAWAKLQAHLNSGNVTQSDLDLLAGIGASPAGPGSQNIDQYSGPGLGTVVGAPSAAPAAPSAPATPLVTVPGLDSQNYGVGLSPYISEQQAATANSAATPEQAAQLAALSQLAGQPNSFLSDPTQAGSYNSNLPVKFDNAGYQTAVTQAQTAYQTKLDALNQQIQAYQAWLAASGNAQNNYNGPVRSISDLQTQSANNEQNLAQIAALKQQYLGTLGGTPYQAPPTAVRR